VNADDRLAALVARQLDAPVPDAVRRLAEAAGSGPGVAAVLFYGAQLRDWEAEGLADLYVLSDRGPVLPPAVRFVEADGPEGRSRAKAARMGLAQFRRRCRRGSLDATVWARFAQPCRLVLVRDAAARAAVLDALREAAATAAWWAAALAPPGASPEEAWTGLFARTYAAELRPEGPERPRALYLSAKPHLDAVLAGAQPWPGPADRARARRAWAVRRAAAPALNLLRLARALAATEGALGYAAWKLARHRPGVPPLAAAASLLLGRRPRA
jgi:hypothetical protein